MSVRHPRTACHRVVNSPAIRLLAAPVVALAIACMPAPATAYGGLDNYQLSREEVLLLPDFCRHTQLIIDRHGSPVEQRQWVDRVGPSFMHMHHYCIAVVAYIRSFRHRNTTNDRTGYLNFAAQNLSYVVRNADTGFALMPEVLYRRGQVALRQGNEADAIKDLEDALQLQPQYSRASYELSQALIKTGDRNKAKRVLLAALEHAPSSKLLISALDELNAKVRQ